MTNRSDPNANSTNAGSNQHSLPPRDGRETLSALFDGELSGDAVRFALKRLDHDADWRDTCGRWQMIGDALRGEATAAAPAGFASGVMQALSAETPIVMATSAASAQAMESGASTRSPRRWIGGAALAASVAMATVLVVRPFSGSPTSPSNGQVAAETAPATTQVPARESTATPASTSTAAASTSSTLAIAAAESRAAGDRSSMRPARAAIRPMRANPAAPIQAQSDDPAIVVASAAQAPNQQPFHPPADDIVTRPWPRAVLSNSAATGAITVGLGTSSTSPPSLYPFEPRLPSDVPPARPQTIEPQR